MIDCLYSIRRLVLLPRSHHDDHLEEQNMEKAKEASTFRIYNPNQNEEIRKRDMFGLMNDNEINGMKLGNVA